MNIPKPILERRRSIRVDDNLHFQFGHAGYDIQAVTIDISTTGAMCLLDADVPLLTKLKIRLSIPTPAKGTRRPRMVGVEGVIVRKDKDPITARYYVGIFFSSISPKDQAFLESYIQSRIQSSGNSG